jgi:hypothetical protein
MAPTLDPRPTRSVDAPRQGGGVLRWLALAGVVYHFYPAAAETKLARIHFWAHNLLLPPLMIALAVFLEGRQDAGPVVGIISIGMLAALGCFAINVLMHAAPSRTA